jgi:hypothetical protein
MSATPDMPMGSPLRSSTGGHSKLDDPLRTEAQARADAADAARERRRVAVAAMHRKLQRAYPEPKYSYHLITDDMARRVLSADEMRLRRDEEIDAEEARARREDARGSGWGRI